MDVPILCVLGSGTQPIFLAACEVVQLWFPKSETLVAEDATHWLHITDARGLAEVLAISKKTKDVIYRTLVTTITNHVTML